MTGRERIGAATLQADLYAETQAHRATAKERDRYRAALRKIARLHPWAPTSVDAAMQEARRVLDA